MEDFIAHGQRPASRANDTEHGQRPASQAQELVEGYLGLARMAAVGVWYGAPLYVHLRGTKAAPGHEPPVEKVTLSTCPTPRKTSYGLACERPIDPETTGAIPHWGNCRGKRNHQQAADPDVEWNTSVCTPLAHPACSGLVTPSMCPIKPRDDRMRTGKTDAFISTNAVAQRESSTVRVRTGLLSGPRHSDGLQRMMI